MCSKLARVREAPAQPSRTATGRRPVGPAEAQGRVDRERGRRGAQASDWLEPGRGAAWSASSRPRGSTPAGSPGSRRCRCEAAAAARRGASGISTGLRLLPRSTTGSPPAPRRQRRSATCGSPGPRAGWSCWPPSPAGPGRRWTATPRTATPHRSARRLLLRRLVDELAADGLTVQAAFEIEWVIAARARRRRLRARRARARLRHDPADRACPTTAATCSARWPTQGVEVEQFHPEYAAGQLEVSVGAEDPVEAADTSVLVRQHDPGGRPGSTGLRTSFSPKVDRPRRRQRRARAPEPVARTART